MKTSISTTISLLTVLFIVSGALGDSWHIETVDTDYAGSFGTSIALDNNNSPHISYNSGGGYLGYACWLGSCWQLDQLAYSDGRYSSIALDGYLPHISYHHYSEDDLEYAWAGGSGWNIDEIDTGTGVGMHTSIALDSNGYPHISYYGGSDHRLKYARWNGSSWQLELVYNGHHHGLGTSIALDSNDYPRFSHYCYSTDEGLRCDWWDGSSWQEAFLDGEIGTPTNSVWSTSIALTSNDYTCITYYDGDDNDLEYVMWNGSSWQYESVDTTGSVGGYASLTLDSSTYPHISYYDESNGDLKYARWNGSSWQLEAVDTEGDVGRWTSIDLDSGDMPHISYYDSSNGELKYAYLVPTGSENSTEQAISQAELLPMLSNPSREALTVRFSVPVTMSVDFEVFDLSGRTVFVLNDKGYLSGDHSIVLVDLSPGMYFCRMNSGGVSNVQCFVVTE